MNDLPLHPVIVHLPMALAVLIPLLAFGLLLAVRKSWLPQRSFWIVVALQAALVGGGLVALQSGEADEERVERVVSEPALEAHEHAAQRFELAAALVLVLMTGSMLVRRASLRQAGAVAGAVGSLAVAALGVDVGHKGGRLVYAEGAGAAYGKAAAGELVTQTPRRHDDDAEESLKRGD